MRLASDRALRPVRVERVILTFDAGTVTSDTIDWADGWDLSRTVTRISQHGGSLAPHSGFFWAVWNDERTLQIEVDGTTSGNSITACVEVAQYDGEIETQYGTMTGTTGDGDATVAESPLLHSTPVGMGMRKDGASFTTDDVYRLDLETPTNLNARSQSTNAGQDLSFMVVNWGPYARVQKLSFTHNTTTDPQQEQTISKVDPSRSLLFGTYDHDNGSAGFHFMSHTMKLLNETQIQTECDTQNNKNYNFVVYVVEFEDGILEAQHVEASDHSGVSGGDDTEVTAIAPIDPTKAQVFHGGAFHGNSFSRTQEASDDTRECAVGITDVSQSSITTFSNLAATARYLPLQVANWIAEAGVVDDAPIAGTGGGSDFPITETITGDTTVSVVFDLGIVPATITGDTTVAAVTAVDVPASATITGDTTVSVSLDLGIVPEVLTGDTDVAATVSINTPVSATITGDTTLAVVFDLGIVPETITGDTTVSASPTLDGDVGASGTITGGTTVTVAFDIAPLLEAITGSTEVAALPDVTFDVNAVITGGTTVSVAQVSFDTAVAETITGDTTVAATVSVDTAIQATITGGTTVSVGYIVPRISSLKNYFVASQAGY